METYYLNSILELFFFYLISSILHLYIFSPQLRIFILKDTRNDKTTMSQLITTSHNVPVVSE
jgi:hypothetical protein